MFKGLTFCASQFSSEERDLLSAFIQYHKGKFSSDLTLDCTHLIVKRPEGLKYGFF